MADPSAASHPRFEQDLREIREDRGVSLPQVQQDTRIPVDVLERFEMGRLTGDPHFNEVYLKALLRAYADSVGVPPADVVKAYQAQSAGTYSGELRQHLPGAAAPAPAPVPPPAEEPVDPPAGDASEDGPKPGPAAAPAVAALRHAPTKEPAAAPPKTETKARVQNRQSVTSSTSSIDSSWGMIIGATLVGVLLIGGVLWLLLRTDDPQPVEREQATVAAPDTVEEDAAPAQQQPATQGPRLATPIEITLIAEDGPLQNFRVTEEPDSRRPYWIEQGDRQTFSSDSMVIIWGTGTGESFGIPAQARLEMQGFTWNPRDGSVLRVDRQRGQALLDSLHRAQGGGAP